MINHWTVGTHSTARAMKTTASEKNGPTTGRGVAWSKRILPLCMNFIDAAQFVSTLTVYRFSAFFVLVWRRTISPHTIIADRVGFIRRSRVSDLLNIQIRRLLRWGWSGRGVGGLNVEGEKSHGISVGVMWYYRIDKMVGILNLSCDYFGNGLIQVWLSKIECSDFYALEAAGMVPITAKFSDSKSCVRRPGCVWPLIFEIDFSLINSTDKARYIENTDLRD